MRTTLRVLLALQLCALFVRADIAPEPITGGLSLERPEWSETEVRLVEESVLIEATDAGWRTTASFVLENTGPATELEVGFPGVYPGELGDFSACVDGQRVETLRRVQPLERPGFERVPLAKRIRDWVLWTMGFEKGQRRRVEVTYASPDRPLPRRFLQTELSPWYHGDEKEAVEWALETRHITYTLHTGALWKGSIERCQIAIGFGEATPAHAFEIQPDGWTVEAGRLSWDLRGVEPLRDIWVSYFVRHPVDQALDRVAALQRKHHDDPALALSLGMLYHETGRTERTLPLYKRFVERWQGSVPTGGTEAELKRFFRAWTMLVTVARDFAAHDRTAELGPFCVKAAPLAEKVLSLAEASSQERGPWKGAGRTAQQVLKACSEHIQDERRPSPSGQPPRPGKGRGHLNAAALQAVSQGGSCQVSARHERFLW